MSTVVALVSDAFGGFGGISQFNRDFLVALADSPKVRRLVALPRVVSSAVGQIPPSIDYRMHALGGLSSYSIACAKVTATERPRLVLCGHINLLPFAVPIARCHRAPLVLVVHGIEVWEPPRPASRMLFPLVDRIVSVSQLTLDNMHSWSHTVANCPASLVPNSVDLLRFIPATNKPCELLDRYGLRHKRVLMTLARLSSPKRYKGVDEVLELMPELLKSDPDIAYLVVGDGNDLPRLQAKAKELRVANCVVFVGRIDESVKVDHYHLADAFVMPGRGEGFGIVFLEAMACGIPVVASVLDGSREAVQFGALGELCDPRDPRTTFSAIRRALGKGRGMRPVGLEYFDVPSFRRRVHDLVTTIMPGQSD